jgi:CheY-like chemotaxis protein
VTSDCNSDLVIVLEDDLSSARALMNLLQEWGYAPLHAIGLRQVLAALNDAHGPVRAIISDYHLEGEATGPEAIDRLAALGVVGRTLLLSGSLRGAARWRAISGGHRVMDKPVVASRLRAWLAEG